MAEKIDHGKHVLLKRIGDVPLHYSRNIGYGQQGRPIGGRYMRRSFVRLLEDWMETLIVYGGQEPAIVVTGGLIGHGRSKHGERRAIDIDSIWWQEEHLITKEYEAQAPFYLCVEATLRMHFGTVLSYFYNQAHQDHWHVDDGSMVGLRKVDLSGRRKSRILFLQHALREVWWYVPITLDGKWGTQTQGLWKEFMEDHALPGLTPQQAWPHFLMLTAFRLSDHI